MGKPSGSKRGFNCPSFKYVAHALAGEPFTVEMMYDCWVWLYPKSAPQKSQISMLLRGDARDGVYLVEHYSSRSRKDPLGRNSIYAVCDQYLSDNPIEMHPPRMSGNTNRHDPKWGFFPLLD